MPESVAAIVVAAGRGLRAGGGLPKQYRTLAGEPVIRPSLSAFAGHPQITVVQPVIHGEDVAMFEAAAVGLALRPAVLGGATRQASVRAGLEALQDLAPDMVLVHDAARPFASSALVSQAIAAARLTGAAVPARSTATGCASCRRRRRSSTRPSCWRIGRRRRAARTTFPTTRR